MSADWQIGLKSSNFHQIDHDCRFSVSERNEPMSQDDHSTQIQGCIDRMRSGDALARDELLAIALERLTRLTRKMLRDFPGVHRWEQTDDVLQNAALRLHRALGEIQPPTVADFFRLAAAQVRRELIDLARRYSGAEGLGAHHASIAAAGKGTEVQAAAGPSPTDTTYDPDRLASWTEFHCQVESLPVEEREAFDLLFYQGLSQAEAAAVLDVSERTIKRRWQAARLRLVQTLGGKMPGL
jgi:RNA polymerase sigma factor (sigma-70 family)